jgi:hypothetical protein
VNGVKLTLFVLAFNIIGFAEGYMLHELASMVGADYPRDCVWRRAAESAYSLTDPLYNSMFHEPKNTDSSRTANKF